MKKILVMVVLSVLLFSKAYGRQKPEFFGVYLQDGKELKEIPQKNLESLEMINLANIMGMPIGIHQCPEIQFKDKKLCIIFYQENIPYQDITLTSLKYQAIKYTPDVFLDNSPITVGMWLPHSEIKLKVSPIKDEKNMYRLVPDMSDNQKFHEGIYCISYKKIKNLNYTDIMGKNVAVYPFKFGDIDSKILENGRYLKKAKMLYIEAKSKNNKADTLYAMQAIGSQLLIEGAKKGKHVDYGIYPCIKRISRDSIRFILDISMASYDDIAPLVQLIMNHSYTGHQYKLLDEKEISGQSLFLFKNGGIVMLIKIGMNNGKEVLEKKFGKKGVYVQTSQNNEYYVWIQKDIYGGENDMQKILRFIQMSLKPIRYEISMLEIMSSRYNAVVTIDLSEWIKHYKL